MYDGKGKKRYHRKIKKNQKSKRPTKSERKKKPSNNRNTTYEK